MMEVVTADGARFALGTVETGASVGIIDYSRRVTDDFGVTTIVQRGFARRLSVRLAVPFDDVDEVQRRLADLRSTAARWIADDRFAWLSPSGFYKDFDVDLAVPPLSYCTLTVEGLAESEAGADTGGDPAPGGLPSTLRLLQPFSVTDAVLAASDVAENDAPLWAAGTGYGVGAKVLRQHRVYEALVANTGNDPVATPAMWLDTGPSNRWAMFDQALGTVTTAQGRIGVRLEIAGIEGVALLDVAGATVRVQADGYDRTQAVTGGAVTFLDLAGRARVTVTIEGAGAVSVGTLLIGRLVALGVTEASPTAGITDFSRKVVDDFGEVTIVKRGFAKRMTAKALIRTDALDQVANRIAAVRAVPALWIGQDGLDSLTVYGFFKDFGIEAGETVSKLSLSIEGLSAAAKPAPIVEWEAVGNSGGKKPTDNADKTSENVSKDTDAVGGLPSAEVKNQLARIEPITTDVSAIKLVQAGHAQELAVLDDARIDMEAIQRQAERDAGRLSEATLRLLAEANRTRMVLRDAGIVVDPVTGIVRIYAIDQLAEKTSKVELTLDAQKAQITSKASVDYVNEKIALAVLDPVQAAQLEPIIARLSSAEQTIDGLKATVQLKADLTELKAVGGRVSTVQQELDAVAGLVETKASQTRVDQIGATLSDVVQQLGAIGDTVGLSVTVRQARIVADKAAEAGLRALLAGDDANQRQIAQVAQARQELITRIDAGLLTEAAYRLALAVEVATVRALTLAETTARIAGDQVSAQSIAALGVTAEAQSAAIGRLDQALISAQGGIAGTQTTIRQIARRDASADEASLRALIAGDSADQRRQAQLVQIQTELTTTLVANEQASAVARQALLARMNRADAAALDLTKVVASLDAATVSRLNALEAQFAAQAADIVAAVARIAREEEARATAISAEAAARDTLAAEVRDVAGDAAQALAEIGQERQVRADADEAEAEERRQIASQVNDPSTGLPWARGAIADLARVTNDRDNSLAQSIQQVRAYLDGIGDVGLQEAFEAVVDRLGKVEGRWSIVIDANGNLSGIQLIGSSAGPASFNLINTDLKLGTGRVIYEDDDVMWVHGVGFGVARDLLEWFGPTMPIDQCSRANAKSYKSTDGSEYMGGSLSIASLTNPGASSSLAADAVAEVGSFGSNGKPVKYIASWSYTSEWTRIYQPDNNGLNAFDQDRAAFNATSDDGGYTYFGSKTEERPASTITLTRSFGSSYEQLEQKSFTTEQLTFRGLRPVNGAGEAGNATFTATIGGGFTVTDPQQSTANRALKLALSRGFNLSEGVIQRLTIVAVEE